MTTSSDYAEEIEALVARLTDPVRRIKPSLVATSSGASSPGLYSWWCDGAGRAVLANVLGTPVGELVYAGQAGAARSQGAVEPNSTLGSRIAGNHLKGNIRGSTLRKTLAACLRSHLDLECTDAGLLTEQSNTALSAWMEEHLSVALAPVAERDRIPALEALVVARLEPPLNLHHVPSSPSRIRLKQLRRALVEGIDPDAIPATGSSDSSVQRDAERAILDVIGKRLGCVLEHRVITLPGGQRVDVDGVSDNPSVLVEAFARQGALLGGQRHKVAGDILKLATVKQLTHRDARLVLALASDDAAKWLTGNTWLAAAAETWGVQIMVADLDADLKAKILAAQQRQRMVNATDEQPNPDD